MNLDPIIRAASRKYGIPESVIKGLIQVESGGDITAVSPAHAFGLTQFIPSTARQYGVRPNDATSQIMGAAHYLSDLGFARDPHLALSSYNAGPGNPGAAGNYADKVLGAAKRYGGGESLNVAGGARISSQGTSGTAAPQRPNLFAALERLTGMTNPGSTAERNYGLLAKIFDSKQAAAAPTPSSGGGLLGAVAASNPLGSHGGRLDEIVSELAKRFGLTVTSGRRSAADNQRVGGSPTSLHLSDRARDLGGTPENLRKAAEYAASHYGSNLGELFYDPLGYYVKKGKRVAGSIGGHGDHLHIGIY